MIERMLTIEEAAAKMQIGVDQVKAMINTNRLDAMLLPNGGGFAIREEDIKHRQITEIGIDSYIDFCTDLRKIKKAHYQHLADIEITFSEAEDKYGVMDRTIRNWQKSGYIRIINGKAPMTVNEQDVAFCAAIYETRKAIGCHFGWPLLDENGNVNLLKYPGYSLYFRKKQLGK